MCCALTGPVLLDGNSLAAQARAHTAAKAADDATPLGVDLIGMNPAVIPDKGDLVIRGVVSNASTEQWTDVNVAPFLSSEPITTRDDLAVAAATEPTDAVGTRLSDPATYVNVGDMLPGQSATFTIRVPRTSMGITGEPGVYWIGVHALGTNADGRDLTADGRARTFIPLVDRRQARRSSVDVSLVLPFRERARRASDGSLAGPGRWESLTSTEGRLRQLADFAASAAGAPVTWEVDPAVLDALEDFGRGNPTLSLGATQRTEETSPSPSPDDAGSATPDPSSASEAGSSAEAGPDANASLEPDRAEDQPDAEQSAQAASVLATFLGVIRGSTLLTLPYGDPDVAALLRDRPSLLTRAQALATRRMQARGLDGLPTVATPDAVFDPDLLGEVDPSTLFVLGDGGDQSAAPFGRLPTGQPLVLTDERTSTGGPAPTGAAEPLALRQRILAEAALDLDEQRPIVVRFPMRWEPGVNWREADFFQALRRSWIRLAPVRADATTTYDGDLPYGRAQRSQEIAASNVADTRALARTGDVLGNLLVNKNDVQDRLTGAALQGSAYSARENPIQAADRVRDLDRTVRARMNEVQVTGTDFVTLSGGSGTLTVNLVNGLAQPISVGLRTRTDSPAVRVESADPVALAPGQRTTLRLAVRSSTGLHEVTMLPVTGNDQVAGRPLRFNVRTSQVGQVIWYVLIGGGALLVVMILRRIVLRIRNRRWRIEETR